MKTDKDIEREVIDNNTRERDLAKSIAEKTLFSKKVDSMSDKLTKERVEKLMDYAEKILATERSALRICSLTPEELLALCQMALPPAEKGGELVEELEQAARLEGMKEHPKQTLRSGLSELLREAARALAEAQEKIAHLEEHLERETNYANEYGRRAERAEAALAEARERETIARYEAARKCAMFDCAIQKLSSIHALIQAENIILPDGRSLKFNPPDNLVREVWEALSKEIRSIAALKGEGGAG